MKEEIKQFIVNSEVRKLLEQGDFSPEYLYTFAENIIEATLKALPQHDNQ